ncbi:MAG: biotin--[acetyl-CoA-carboxylase] ligase [Calothrix sp. MO_167.B12]|nr:biotin--[acetyl-CoA-carboxylase] ligase [Calothrix sp. MO_167.B12]
MQLDRQQLQTSLERGRKSAYLPFSLHIFDTVSSTNQILWDLLAQGASPGCVVIATQQTAGKGQWGRQWISPGGGLYLSLAIDPQQLPARNSYQLTLASAWGVAEKLRNCGIDLAIKWPNDLVLEQRKLGGILTETKINQGKINQALIGIGINWANPVPKTGINLQMWQAIKEQHVIPSLEDLAAQVLLGIESGIQCLFQEGVNILISHYLQLLTNIGDRICVNNAVGTVVGVTHTGELHVRIHTDGTRLSRKPEIYLQPGTISLGYCQSS